MVPVFKHFTLLLFLAVFAGNNLWAQAGNEQRRSRKQKARIVQQPGRNQQPTPVQVASRPSPVETVLTGRVIDEQTGDPLMGATIQLKGVQIGTYTDLNGTFRLVLPPNTAPTLVVSYVSYTTKEIGGIDLTRTPLVPLNITLAEQATELQTVTVQTTARQESDVAAQTRQLNNFQVADVFSGEMILKVSSDLTIGTALSRMPGVSLIEDRYLVIRGLYERYNTILLNGAPLPVMGNDRQTFDFANLPSNMMASLQLVKSGQPDQIGTYAGGLINVETPNLPEQRKLLLNYQTVLDTKTSFTTVNRFRPDNNGLLGLLSSVNPVVPKDFPAPSQTVGLNPTSQEALNLGRQFNNNVVPESRFNLPGQNISLRYENVWTHGRNKLGLVTGANTFRVVDFENKQLNIVSTYDTEERISPITDQGLYTNYFERQGANAYLNLTVQRTRTRIMWYNWLSVWQENLTSTNTGSYIIDPETNQFGEYYFTPQRFRRSSLYTTQLKGEHLLGSQERANNLKLNWLAFANLATSQEPIYRAMNFLKDSTGEYRYDLGLTDAYEVFENAFTATQADHTCGGDVNIQVPFRLAGSKVKVKAGQFVHYQHRRFDSRVMALFPNRENLTLTDEQLHLDNLPNLFDPQNIRPDGFNFRETTSDSSRHFGYSLNLAPYVMAEWNPFNRLAVLAGLRMEYQHEKLNNRAVLTDEALPLVDRNQVDWLPSLTLRYQLTDRMNLKLTNYQSVSRPNLRELTNFTYYHFINAVYWTGNPVLKRTYISNVDLRWEWFPSGLDQFSFTLFYKHFNNPIEQYIQEGSIGVVQQLSLVNRERGSATGLELEARKNLGFLAPGTQLGNLTVYFNLAVLQSRINSDFALFQTGRSLQGQSPAVFNAGVFYTYPDWQLTAGVFYNVTGQRIAIVGTGPESFPDIWERRRHVVDLQVAKRFGNKLEVKAALQDIFNMPIQTAQFYDGKTTYDPDRSRLITNIQRGLRAIVSVSYTFQ